jgi:hypothetical protein
VFFNGPLEYLLVGGGLSLITVFAVLLLTDGHAYASTTMFATIILLSNSAHFAASTVRLYTKPDHAKSWPFLTMLFPLVSLVVLTICMMQPERLGSHLQSLYLTWSPYHYAAQAYGLAVMYSARSGCKLSLRDKKWLRGAAMLPFVYAFFNQPGAGILWLLGPERIIGMPWLDRTLGFFGDVLPYVGFAAPLLLLAKTWRGGNGMPLIAALTLVTNGVWWFVFTGLQAFLWATVFHGIQYLVFVLIFHVREQMARPDNRHGVAYHVAAFYGACVLLGYGLFQTLPWAYTMAGFGMVESMLLVVAAINVHHFIVDAFIWRLRKGDSNVRVVEGTAVAYA